MGKIMLFNVVALHARSLSCSHALGRSCDPPQVVHSDWI
jgi:hypothetical protein